MKSNISQLPGKPRGLWKIHHVNLKLQRGTRGRREKSLTAPKYPVI